MLRGLAPARDKGLGFIMDPSFGAHIMMEPLLKYFKMLQLEIYDGSTDPLDHLESFKAPMHLYGAIDGVL